MDRKIKIKEDNNLLNIMNNIDYARILSLENQSVKMVVVVSGNEPDRLTWYNRLLKTGEYLFNRDGSTAILSLQEKAGEKTKEGNFLGTLLAYINLKEILQAQKRSCRDFVILMGMLFGRGERMSPFTQIEGDRKPAIIVSSQIINNNKYPAAIEEALFHFVPVAKYLELRGFRGILDKWGDETEIASIDLSEKPATGSELSQCDVIKCVSYVRITEELAKEKDWIVSDVNGNVTAILSRNDRSMLTAQLDRLGIKPSPGGEYYAGVSLGPVAVSYNVLDIAAEVFHTEIYKNGIYFDFDPYLVMALSTDMKNLHIWEEAEKREKDLKTLLSRVPDFFIKVQRIKRVFEERYHRKLSFKILDLGPDIFWADIGQHYAMRQKYMSLNENNRNGEISRKLERIKKKRDVLGNIIINSRIDKGISIRNSIIINSILTGTGKIKKSVVKDSLLNDPVMTCAFSVLSYRPRGKTCLHNDSGLYRSIGINDLELGQGMRHGTLITKSGVFDMMISESADLRDRDKTYNIPIFKNEISFAEAYDEMFGVSEEELEEWRNKWVMSFLK